VNALPGILNVVALPTSAVRELSLQNSAETSTDTSTFTPTSFPSVYAPTVTPAQNAVELASETLLENSTDLHDSASCSDFPQIPTWEKHVLAVNSVQLPERPSAV